MISLTGVTKAFGHVPVLAPLTLEVATRARLALGGIGILWIGLRDSDAGRQIGLLLLLLSGGRCFEDE